MTIPRQGIRIACVGLIVSISACRAMPVEQVRDQNPGDPIAYDAKATPLNAEQLAQRLLLLISNLKKPEDMTLEQIERIMNVAMQPSHGNPTHAKADGRLNATWSYSLATVDSSYKGVPFALRLRYDDGRDNRMDMSSICEFAYDDYARTLESLGFQSRVIAGNTRQINFNHESGSGLYAILYVRSESSENPQKRCVEMAIVDFLPTSQRAPHLP